MSRQSGLCIVQNVGVYIRIQVDSLHVDIYNETTLAVEGAVAVLKGCAWLSCTVEHRSATYALTQGRGDTGPVMHRSAGIVGSHWLLHRLHGSSSAGGHRGSTDTVCVPGLITSVWRTWHT